MAAAQGVALAKVCLGVTSRLTTAALLMDSRQRAQPPICSMDQPVRELARPREGTSDATHRIAILDACGGEKQSQFPRRHLTWSGTT